jgi:eukaryotic-like serine/threonine-protein kinase
MVAMTTLASQVSSRFTIVRSLFDEVVALPADAREAHLRTLNTDIAIMTEVLALCAVDDRERHTHFSTPLNVMIAGITAPKPKLGDTLGVWKLIAEVGLGGMGQVFRAARSDGQFEQEAAIKLLHGIPSAKALEYLARERQILATLTHPNIARLYDGGTTPSGQPYLVMEYVEGTAIDTYAGEKKLSINDILTLMLDVCDALTFAHQRLVVHCDIKPSNILVTANQRPMLLDFGIARLLDGQVSQQTLADATAHNKSSQVTLAQAFTPRYASPEQLKGETLTTATDVYSLGKMLAELTKIAANQTGIDKELRAIITKATETDTLKRYATASALAADIVRYRQRLPLQAMPLTPIYRTQKFTQRNWPWLTAACVFVLTIAAATTNIINERNRAQSAELAALIERDATALARAEALRERDRATAAELNALTDRDRAKASETLAVSEKNRATQAEASSRQTSEFLVSVFDSSNPNAESGDIPASKLITAAEARLEKEMVGQPQTQASLYSAMGRVQSNMGRPNEARKNYRLAIAMERKQNRPLELARVLTLEFQNDVLKLDNSNMLSLAREALALREQYAPADSIEVAQSLAYAGYALRATSGDLKQAEQLITRALAIYEKRDANSLGMAEAQHIAGQVYGVLGQRERAIAAYRRSIAIKQIKLGDGHPDVMLSLQYLAGDLNRTRQFVEAESIFRRIVAQNEKLHGRQNVNMLRPLVYLGNVLIATGRPREALTLAEEALQIAEKTVGRDSTYAALVLSNVGAAKAELGDLVGAAAHFRESLMLMKKYMRPIDNAVAEQQLQLGRTLSRMGEANEAMLHLQGAYDIYKKVLGDTHRLTLSVVAELARAAILQDKLADALMWQAKLPTQLPITDKDIAAEIAMAHAFIATKQATNETALQKLLAAERLFFELYGERDQRTWLAQLPRSMWLAARGKNDRTALTESQQLAAEIMLKVEGKLTAESMVLVRLRQLARE